MKENQLENIDGGHAENNFLDKSKNTYRRFEDYVRFTENDPLWMLVYKLAFRFLGIGIMILLSPFLIIGLAIAFIAVF